MGVNIVQWDQVGSPGIDNDNIGLLARLQRTNDVAYPQHPGTINGRHPHHSPRVHHRGIKGMHLVEFGHGVHLLKQVQIVIAGTTVSPDPYRDAMLKEFRNRSHA